MHKDYDVVVLYHSKKPGNKSRHIFGYYATRGCAREFIGTGIDDRQTYGAIVMRAFEKFCRGTIKLYLTHIATVP